MNNVILLGRMARDPELKFTDNGKAMVKFTLAVSRNKDETDFIDCVAWDKTAENTAQYTSKGSQVVVEGRLQIRNYELDGQKRKAAEVVAHRVTFLDRRD